VSITITSESGFFQPAKNMIKFTWLRRAVVAVIGLTVLLIGLAMVVLPGPAVIVIPLGLAILATEFVWARRLLEKARASIAGKDTGKKKQSHSANDQIESVNSIRQSDE
jgi:uncharacterized protein (TIGR02611 family)